MRAVKVPAFNAKEFAFYSTPESLQDNSEPHHHTSQSNKNPTCQRQNPVQVPMSFYRVAPALTASILSLAIPRYSTSRSMPMNRCPNSKEATPVVLEPQKGSRTSESGTVLNGRPTLQSRSQSWGRAGWGSLVRACLYASPWPSPSCRQDG